MKRWFAVVVVGVLLTVPLSAQTTIPSEGTPMLLPESTEEVSLPSGLAVTHTFDWLYPMGITFRFQINVPASDIRSFSGSVEQSDWAGQTLPIDLAKARTSEPTTDITVVWSIPPESPALFKPITFTWVVEAAGETVTLTDTFEFADPRFRWKLEENGEIVIAVAGGLGFVSYSQVVAAVNVLLTEDASKPVAALRAVVYPETATLNPCAREGDLVGASTGGAIACDTDAVERLFARQGFEVVKAINTSADSVINALVAGQIRQAFSGLWENSTVPAWFKEGLTAFYTPLGKSFALQSARNAERAGQLSRSLDLVPDEPNRRNLWSAQSIGWVQYIAYRAGFSALRSLAMALDQGAEFASALDGLGLPVGVIDSGWRSWLFSNSAANLYGLYAGSPPTVTPTEPPLPTVTQTPSQTHTATLTETPSITPTPSDTGTPVPTATPTFTPSLTPTPTVTLRPALSFTLIPTPTPTPIGGIPPEDSGTLPWPVYALALVMAGSLVYVIRDKRKS